IAWRERNANRGSQREIHLCAPASASIWNHSSRADYGWHKRCGGKMFPQARISGAEEKIFRLVDPGGEVGRSAAVGVQLLHQLAVGALDRLRVGPFLQPEDTERLRPSHPGLAAGGAFLLAVPAMPRHRGPPVEIRLRAVEPG